MRFERPQWTPLTVVFESPDECEALHKILGLVEDETDERMLNLFYKLGQGLDVEYPKFRAVGKITIESLPEFD